jgi:hypothetical protein
MNKVLRYALLSFLVVGLVLAVVALPGGVRTALADSAASREINCGNHRLFGGNDSVVVVHPSGAKCGEGEGGGPEAVEILLKTGEGALYNQAGWLPLSAFTNCVAGTTCIVSPHGAFTTTVTLSADGTTFTITVTKGGAQVGQFTLAAPVI